MISRRDFLFGLAGVMCLQLPRPARAAVGLFQPFNFAYITDVHLVNGMSDSYKLLQESQLFLQDLVKQLNGEKLDFVLFGGDQVECPGQNDDNWQLFLDVMDTLQAPWTFVLGEQDVSGPTVVDKMHTYGVDWKGKGIETGNSYWSYNPLSGVHLIGLDTSRPNSPTGEMSQEQLDWLKSDLEKNTRQFTIVASHHPLLPPAPFDGGPPWDDYIVPQGANAREILGGSKYVRLVLNGHVHVSKIQKEGDIWYVSNPSLDVYPCGYRIFRIAPELITVETYQVLFPALIKKAFQDLASSPFAFKYNERKPQAFCELAEGMPVDQNSILPLAPGSQAQAIRPPKRSKKEAPAKTDREGHKRQNKHDKETEPEKPAAQDKKDKPDKHAKSKPDKKQSQPDQSKQGKNQAPSKKQSPSKDQTPDQDKDLVPKNDATDSDKNQEPKGGAAGCDNQSQKDGTLDINNQVPSNGPSPDSSKGEEQMRAPEKERTPGSAPDQTK